MSEVKTRKRNVEEEEPDLPQSWLEKASEAARRFKVPVPKDIPEQEEVERRLRELEQEDGE